jgi:hypothetical protein
MTDQTNAQKAAELAGYAEEQYAAGHPADAAPLAQAFATLALVDQLADLEDAVRGLLSQPTGLVSGFPEGTTFTRASATLPERLGLGREA